MSRLTPEREKEIRKHWLRLQQPNDVTILIDELDALRAERDEARKFYGPAGLRAVSSFIEERDGAKKLCATLLASLDYTKAENARIREALEKIYPSLPSYLGEAETSDYPCLRRIADEALNAQAAKESSDV